MPYDHPSNELQLALDPRPVDPEFLRYVEQGASQLLWFAEPAIEEELARFRRGIEGLPPTSAIDPAALARLLLPQLFELLQQLLEQVLVLELNVARVQKQLQGETPAQRFDAFCARLRQSDVRSSIAQEYPLLLPALRTHATHWVDGTLELLQRLSSDWDVSRDRLLGGTEPGRLTAIRLRAGDPHRRGRTVALLEFEAGAKLVYKPHSQSIDVHFGELLEWINRAGFDTPFRPLRVIDRGRYGWSEFVTRESCSSRAALERFYRRLGGYLAVFHVLRARDMHFENVLAAGEHPMPIDLETLFHNDATPAQLDDPAIDAFQTSVLQTMLLPQPMYLPNTDEVIDMSAFGATTGQSFPLGRKLTWQAPATDEMRLVAERTLPTLVASSRPMLDGREVAAGEYHPAFLAGFRWVYRLLEQRRDELLAPDGLLERFARDEVRYVARATATYAALLEPCSQPNQLRSAAERDRLLQRLWLGASEQPHLGALVPAEQRDLAGGDIPLFTSRPDSRDVWTSDGERINAFFARSALALVREGLLRMGDADLALQERLIRTAIATGTDGAAAVNPSSATPAPPAIEAIEPRGALAAARAIGDRLCRDALQSEASASWIGATALGPDGRASIQPLDVSLYGGLSGCALFLAYLAELTGDASYREVAHKALALARRHIDRGVSVPGVGGFTGLGGIIYTLAQLSVLWNDRALLDEAHRHAKKLGTLVAADKTLDVIGGCAGAIAALEVLNGIRPSEELLAIAKRCGEHLLEQQLDCGGWNTDTPASRPLTGFSHGAAGIAWALLKLDAWSGQARFRLAAEAATAYERSTFLAEQANWPDYRTLGVAAGGGPRCELAWCHGAPGIGLARIDSLAQIDSVETRREIQIALRQTLASPFGRHSCLCHGDLGNLDILLYASERLGDRRWSDAGKRLASAAVNAIAARDDLRDASQQLANPGLMVGLAGIGYGLLRLVDPQRVPSLLVLAPPK